MNYNKILIRYIIATSILALTYMFTISTGELNILQWSIGSKAIYILFSTMVIVFFSFMRTLMK